LKYEYTSSYRSVKSDIKYQNKKLLQSIYLRYLFPLKTHVSSRKPVTS